MTVDNPGRAQAHTADQTTTPLRRRGFLRAMTAAALSVPLSGVLADAASAAGRSKHGVAFGRLPRGGANLLVNPGFEDGLTGWTVDGKNAGVATDVAHGGGSSLLIAPSGGTVAVEQRVPVTPGATYTFGSWHQLQPGGFGAEVWLFLDDANGRTRVCLTEVKLEGEEAGEWQQVAYTFTVPPELNAPNFLVRLWAWGAAKPYYCDDIALVQVASPLSPSVVWLLASGATSALPIEHAGTNSGRFGLIDEYPKYFSDSLGDISRIFQNMPRSYVPSGPEVADAAGYEAAKAAVSADPHDNAFYTIDMLNSDTAELVAPQSMFRWSANRVQEMQRMGAKVLLVMPQWYARSDAYGQLWRLWRRMYAHAYLMAKNYGVTDFNIMNEPGELLANDLERYLFLLREEAGAIRAGLAAAQTQARIWAPTAAGGGRAATMDIIVDRAHDVIDVYDWHQYDNSTDSISGHIERAKARLIKYNGGVLKPLAMSEYSYALAVHLKADDFDAMPNVFNNMVLTFTQVKEGLALPVHFMFPRMHRNQGQQQPPGTFSVGLTGVDDTSGRMSRGTKMYYGYRMLYRALKAPRELVDVRVYGLDAKHEVLVTRGESTYEVLLLNRGVDPRRGVALNLSALGVPNGRASVRRVSYDKDDEFIGNVEVVAGRVTLVDTFALPPQSMTLLTIPRHKSIKSARPVIQRAFGGETGNELWWSNQAAADTFTVQRCEGDGDWITVGQHVTDSFFTDTTAVVGRDYAYRVFGVTAGKNGEVAVAGPLRRPAARADVLPVLADFETGDANSWDVVKGTWEKVLDYEDSGYRTDAGPGEDNVALLGGAHSWGSQYMVKTRFKVDRLGAGATMGIVAQYSDAANHYTFDFNEATGVARIMRVAGGVQKLLAYKWLAKCDQSCHRPNTSNYRRYLIGVVNGSELKMYLTVNETGIEAISAVDPDPLPSGRVGLAAGNDVDIFFDGLAVSAYMDERVDAGLSRWSLAGDWQATGDASKWLTQTVVSSAWSTALVGTAAWQDLEMAARVRLDPATPEGTAALLLRYADADNHYRIELIGGRRVRAVRRVAGVETVLADKGGVGALTAAHTLNVWLDRNLHRVWLDGHLVAEFTDYEPSLATGRVGVGAKDAIASFGRIRVNTALIDDKNQ